MFPIFAILGAFALLAVLEKQHGSIAAGTITTGNTVSGSSTNGLGSLGGDYAMGENMGLKAVSAIPVVGPVLSQIGGKIIGMISQHHAQALKAEGRALNDATPRMIQTFGLIVQAVAKGEITSQTQVNQLADRTVSLFYGEVKPIQRGHWPFAGDMSADYDAVWIRRTQKPGTDYHAPDPCNAACVMGHFFAERNAMLVKYACADCLAGNHGSVVFPEIPKYATQQGYPQSSVTY
jgi:hypothetical protein